MVDTSTNSWKLLYEAGRQALQARKLQEAEQSFSAALQLAEDFAPADPRLAATLNALARIYSLQRRYLAAAALLNRLLEVTERTLGANHIQVAGVLTNLAEMYTHLGAAREELDLRERVLAIRADDPNADAAMLQRLRERVTELRAMLAAEEPVDPTDDMEPLPAVRTEEYSSPVAPAHQPSTSAFVEPAMTSSPRSATMERDDAYRPSPPSSQLLVAPWPGVAATGTTPSGARTVETARAAERDVWPKSSVQLITVSEPSPVTSYMSRVDHGFSDMGRDDEVMVPLKRRKGGRTSLYSIAAGVVLVAAILAARSYLGGSNNDEREAAGGSVNLANATVAPVIRPVAATTPAPVEPRAVDRAEPDERRPERSITKRSERAQPEPVVTERPSRTSNGPDLERTLRAVDGALKTIDQRTRAANDSAMSIRLQVPTFKQAKVADVKTPDP